MGNRIFKEKMKTLGTKQFVSRHMAQYKVLQQYGGNVIKGPFQKLKASSLPGMLPRRILRIFILQSQESVFQPGHQIVREALSAFVVDSYTEGSAQKHQFPECPPSLLPLQCSLLESGPLQPMMLFLGFWK